MPLSYGGSLGSEGQRMSDVDEAEARNLNSDEEFGIRGSAGSANTFGSANTAGRPLRSSSDGEPAPRELRDEAPHMLQGDDALAASALLLAQTLQNERTLARWSDVEDLVLYVDQVRLFLTGVFEGAEWPQMYVTPDFVDCPALDGVVNVMLDATREPLPLGEDILTAVLATVIRDKLGDRRIVGFFKHIRHKVEEQLQRRVEEALATAQIPTAHLITQEELESEEPQVDTEETKAAQEAIVNLGGAEVAADAGINVVTLEELSMNSSKAAEVKEAWTYYVENAKSRQVAGEQIFTGIFERTPSLQSMFTTPRAVQAMRFIDSLHAFVLALGNPRELKVLVETLGFGHLQHEVTVARLVSFRDAVLDVFSNELGMRWTEGASEGWRELLNYLGGAMIFCKAHFTGRLAILRASWKRVNNKGGEPNMKEENKDLSGEHGQSSSGMAANAGLPEAPTDTPEMTRGQRWKERLRVRRSKKLRRRNSEMGSTESGEDEQATTASEGAATGASQEQDVGGAAPGEGNTSPRETTEQGKGFQAQHVPTTFKEMFIFNAAVVGLRNISWHQEILKSFGDIVTNVSTSARLNEEVQVLALRITKCTMNAKSGTKGPVNLSEFKFCMLAALRALLPKVWDSQHEVAWAWLWENVERLLKTILGHPPVWQAQLEETSKAWTEETRTKMCKAVYERFFDLRPAGQDFFKQSETRLLFIASNVLDMPLALFGDPWGVVEDISGIGLRHVGYGVPNDLVGPFVTSWIEVFNSVATDNEAMEAFRWSIDLVAKILVRTINEGSTIVMKAVNANNAKQLTKALAGAPRAARSEWVLNVQVGTQQISPLLWAIQSGSLEAAAAIIKDLLTIRADREKYYYGVDAVFQRHEDIVGQFVEQARNLVPVLFDGLIWRSRHTKLGLRRVNYYVRHLIVDPNGNLAEAAKSLCLAQDGALVSHPVLCLVSDTLWSGVVKRQFILSKLGFLFGLFLFLMCQAILPKLRVEERIEMRYVIFCGRMLNYMFTLVRLGIFHGSLCKRAYIKDDLVRIGRCSLPRYLKETKMRINFAAFVLIAFMLLTEPMLHCIGDSDQWPTEECGRSDLILFPYTVLAMGAMILQWLMLTDMAAGTTKLSAFVLVCKHVLSEVGRFVVAMMFLMVTFASAITCLRHDKEEFKNVPMAANCLFAITVGLYEGDYREFNETPILLIAVFIFVTLSAIILINLLIAQLNCSYEYVYADMMGFARLTRATLIVDTLATTPAHRWIRFLGTLRFDQPVEFDEGDVGLAGAIQVKEPASLNPVVVDSIIRYGGTCAGDAQWPEDHSSRDTDDRFERVERAMQATLKRLSSVKMHHRGQGSGSGMLSGEGGSMLHSNSDEPSHELHHSSEQL